MTMTDKLKNILLYTGLAAACTGAIGYLIIIYALVMGFQNDLTTQQMLLVAIIGAVDGIFINIALRYQGIAFAKLEDEAKKVNRRYQELINTDRPVKKYKLIGYFMFWSIVRDILFKGVTVGLSTYLIIYTFVEGNGDYSLFLVALSNILLFVGLGTMALKGMYDKYTEEHIPALIGLCNKLDVVASVPPKEKQNANIQQRSLSKDAPASTEK